MLGVDLTAIDGIDVGSALVILSEIGADVSRFPVEKHFASWLRLCPLRTGAQDRPPPPAPKGAIRVAPRRCGWRPSLWAGRRRRWAFLPPDQERSRRRRGNHGVCAQAGVAGVPDAQVWSGYVMRSLEEYEAKMSSPSGPRAAGPSARPPAGRAA